MQAGLGQTVLPVNLAPSVPEDRLHRNKLANAIAPQSFPAPRARQWLLLRFEEQKTALFWMEFLLRSRVDMIHSRSW
jgi:hypothetical protein